ncbi:MAG: long-chain fatty acid--CoA ligase, partial [Deltaproteobacteria bacterium]|nr:long-chain fatty acid--CoA ligase [Deltaproteobacteria bacterium]
MTIIPDLLRKRAREFPDSTAVQIEDQERITFRELDVLSSRIANLLLREGLRPHDKVSVAIPNAHGIFYVASYFGTQKAGGVFVPINVRYSREEVEKQVRHSDSSFLLVADELLKGWRITGAGSVRVLALSRAKELLEGVSGTDPDVRIEEDDPAEIIYTSGTTGIPKGVVVPHHSITSFDETPWVQLFSGKTSLHPVPLYTFAGMTMTVLPIRLGMKCILMKKFDAHRFVDLLEKEQVFSVYAVSSMWLIVLKEVPDLRKRDFSGLLFLQFGAAPMPPSAVLELSDIFTQANVINLYGLTESGAAGYMMPFGEARSRPNSVGKPVDENTEIRIVDE